MLKTCDNATTILSTHIVYIPGSGRQLTTEMMSSLSVLLGLSSFGVTTTISLSLSTGFVNLTSLGLSDAGNGTVSEPRLYQLIRQSIPIADRQFEIEFLDAGVEAFSFTFG